METETTLCPSKKEDGDQCGFELTFGFKWCPECGARVSPAWFQQKGKCIKVDNLILVVMRFSDLFILYKECGLCHRKVT